MIFKIDSFDKTTDLYMVSSDTGEKKCVSGLQIVGVLLKGFKFVNAKLTNKGFAILTNNGTRYVQVNGLDRQTLIQMHDIVDKERTTQQSQAKPIARAKSLIKRPINKNSNATYAYGSTITVQGKKFRNEREMCASFNRSYETYCDMIKKGYNREEALGIVEARPLDVVIKEKIRTQHMLDSMAVARGDF